MNGVPDKGRMELMGHKTAEMTARYTHLSVEYKRQAVASLPQFGKAILEAELQQTFPRTLPIPPPIAGSPKASSGQLVAADSL